ncbi:hypothetical protein ONN26_25730, partial [Salmonella enterica subsp. enterica serovar Muenster]|nr:hypothetical protein [Salmonella enterica subsp. enterica serovar Muenster]
TLVLLRFLTGLGLGGAMPNTITMTSEYLPARRRGALVTLMFCVEIDACDDADRAIRILAMGNANTAADIYVVTLARNVQTDNAQ